MEKKSSVNIYDLNLPSDLRKLTVDECDDICAQIRDILVDTVSKNGGHLASNLGTVELSVALHRVFHSPKDKLVWDVSHQSYTHKLLTGRLESFNTLRQQGGISGFTRPSESKHDAFVGGHSSTAVSAALGMATAMRLKGDNKHSAVAIVGDGATSGGLFFEGINNAGKSKTNTIVVINNNEMSISKSVGGFAKYLSVMRTSDSYIRTKGVVQTVLDKTPILGKPIANTIRYSKNVVKEALIHSNFFEEMGFEFIGPIDGHNIAELEYGLRQAKNMHKPVIVYVMTVKGKGYAPAEANPGEYHGVGSFEIKTGNPDVTPADSFSTEFGCCVSDVARDNNKVCAVTAAMKYGTGLQYFAKEHPSRFFDVGIAEEHAVTFCGGLASMGMIPVFAVYSTFLQRAVDQIIHDLAISNTHAVIGVDRAGIVGGDGETHQGIFDVSLLTSIPNTTVYSPSCYEELHLCTRKAILSDNGVCAVRYPRGEEAEICAKSVLSTDFAFENNSADILLVTYGRLYENVIIAKNILNKAGVKPDVLKLVKIHPVSKQAADIIASHKKVFFFEESYENGSVSQKLDRLANESYATCITDFLPHSDVGLLLDKCGLSPEKIAKKVMENI